MKKAFLCFSIIILAVIMAATLLMGCKTKSSETTTSEATTVTTAKAEETTQAEAETTVQVKKIHFIFVPKLVHPWYDAVEAGIKTAIEDYAKEGYEITYDWNAPQSADIALHVQTVEAATMKKPDILAVSSLDPASDTPVINEAVDNGTKVLTFDCDAPDSKRTIYVGLPIETDINDSGKMIADFMVKQMGTDKGEIALLAGSPTAPNHVARVESFKKYIAEAYPDLKLVAEEFDEDSIEKSVTLTEAILSSHPNLKAIYGVNASDGVGAVQAIKAAGKKAGEITVMGVGDLAELMDDIKTGYVSGTYTCGVFVIGYQAIKYGVAMFNGEEVPDTFAIPAVIISKDNLDGYEKLKVSKVGLPE